MTQPIAGSPSGPLAGLRVVELGQVFAGPFAGMVFADLGADVVKVERVDGGDDARRMGPPFRDGDSINFHAFNRGKRSVALDLREAADRDTFERLAAGADVFLHNLRPGVAETFGIGSAALCERHPRLVYCEISAFGTVGPEGTRPGYEPLIQAYSGLFSVNGGPEDRFSRAGVAVCDQGSGMWAVIGALSLLRRREATGRGGVVDTSLLETALMWEVQHADAWINQGRLPERNASGHSGFFPYEAFEAQDGPFLICAGNDRLFAKLAAVLDHPEWATDPRTATNRARLANRAALGAEMSAILGGAPRTRWLAALGAVGVPCSPINTVPEALEQPQVRALGMRQPVPGGDYTLTGLPMRLDGERPTIRQSAPRLGADTASVREGAWE